MKTNAAEFPICIRSGSITVKIYRVENKGRTAFSISYFANGKRKMKMFSVLEKAVKEAKEKAGELARGELDVVELRSSDRFAYIHAVNELKPTGVPLELAAKEYAEAWKVMGGRGSLVEAAREYARRKLNALPHKLVPEAVADLIAVRTQEGTTPAYVKALSVYLNQFKEVFACPLLALTTSQVTDYLRALKVSGRSKNNARGAIGAFFKHCKERGWLPRDHEGISFVSKFKEAANEIEIFTPRELAQFLGAARPEMIPFLAIGAFAGLRSAEIGRLDWNEIHFVEKFIEVKAAKAKTASRRLIPISDNLAKWLADYAEKEGRVVPFDNLAKQIGWMVDDVNESLRKAAELKGENPEKIKAVEWKKNALRHSYISYRVAEIQNVNQVALEAGNSPAIIFRNYRELVRPAQAKEWFSIMPEKPANVIKVKRESKAA
jgi:integrase